MHSLPTREWGESPEQVNESAVAEYLLDAKRIVKTKLKIIVATFAATTVFWCLVVAGSLWCNNSIYSGTDRMTQLRRFGYHYLLGRENYEGRSTTLSVICEVRPLPTLI